MVQVEVTKNNKKIGKLKDDSVYILNYAKHIMKDRPLETFVDDDNKMNENFEIVDKRKYEKTVSECKKLRTFIKTVVGRNITVLLGK